MKLIPKRKLFVGGGQGVSPASTIQHIQQTIDIKGDIDTTPTDGATTKAISSDWAYDHENDTSTHGVTGTILGTEDVDDTPVDGATTDPISSNWAYDHAAGNTGATNDNKILAYLGM